MSRTNLQSAVRAQRTAVLLAIDALALARVGVAADEETISLGATAALGGLIVSIANAVADPQWIARSVPLAATFVGLFLMLTARALWRQLTVHLRPGRDSGEKLLEQLFGGAEGDGRSKHPLISHAPVSPLSVDVVRQYDLRATHLGMLQAFEDCVRLPDPMAVSTGVGGSEYQAS